MLAPTETLVTLYVRSKFILSLTPNLKGIHAAVLLFVLRKYIAFGGVGGGGVANRPPTLPLGVGPGGWVGRKSGWVGGPTPSPLCPSGGR